MRQASFILVMSLLIGFSLAIDINLEGKPTFPPEEEKVDISSIISKQKTDPVFQLSGRSGATKTKLVQGDIAVDESEKAILSGLGRSAGENLAVLLWPRKTWRTRVVPYTISGHSRDAIGKIEAAMRDLEKKICLTFRQKRYNDKSWLYIYRGSSCWARIGRSIAFGKTDVSLASYCLSKVLIQHEIIHALGFFHEQSRRDRDNYVRILKYNVQPSNLYNFDIMEKTEGDTFGVPYDYRSIMHYSRTTWTKNGANTMEAKYDTNQALGGQELSKYDILKLKHMYHCHEKSGTLWTEWSDWSSCIETYKGCYRSKHRTCLVENLALCPGADEWGVQSSAQKCPSLQHCKVEPVDGLWGKWGSWSSCSRSCDRGTRVRSRSCDSPKPAYGGSHCKGSKTHTEKCIRRTCKPNKYFTNFDSGFGIWSNVKNSKDPLDWKRGRGRTSSTTGPNGDHTDGKGWFAYVSPQSYVGDRKKATLVSQYLSGKKCISLSYCMNGKSMGTLEFYLQKISGGYAIFPPKKKGHQGKEWHHLEFSLNHASYDQTKYRFFIEATTGNYPNSDIAIDDLWIEDGPCGAASSSTITGLSGAVKPPESVSSGGCRNRNDNCIAWSKKGECHRNSGYMLEHCCLACRGMGKCDKDIYNSQKCSEWSRSGECVRNGKWMWKNCCSSCKKLGNCINKNNQCDQWAKQFCNKKENKEWMWMNCCAACSAEWEEEKKCSDKNDGCKDWARDGECKKNTSWMKANCCRSCKSV